MWKFRVPGKTRGAKDLISFDYDIKRFFKTKKIFTVPYCRFSLRRKCNTQMKNKFIIWPENCRLVKRHFPPKKALLRWRHSLFKDLFFCRNTNKVRWGGGNGSKQTWPNCAIGGWEEKGGGKRAAAKVHYFAIKCIERIHQKRKRWEQCKLFSYCTVAVVMVRSFLGNVCVCMHVQVCSQNTHGELAMHNSSSHFKFSPSSM